MPNNPPHKPCGGFHFLFVHYAAVEYGVPGITLSAAVLFLLHPARLFLFPVALPA